MRSTKIAAVALTGALSLSLAACGSSSDTAGSGSSSSAAAPAGPVTANLTNVMSGMTQVTLDSGFVSALTMLKVTPSPFGKATIEGGVATFPITSGNVDVMDPAKASPYITGMLNHEGSGLTLTVPNLKVTIKNFVVDPGTSMLTGDVTANDKPAVQGAPLFILDGSTLMPVRVEGTDAIVQGTTVKMTMAAAGLLNKTFGVTAFKEGLVIGVAKITVPTK